MVRSTFRHKEADWAQQKIYVTKRYIEKKKEAEQAQKITKTCLNEVFPKFQLINDVYYETEEFNLQIQMYKTLQIDHILLGNQAVYVIETRKLPGGTKLYGGSNSKKWVCVEFENGVKKHAHKEINADRKNREQSVFIQRLIRERLGINVPVIPIVNIVGISDKEIYLNLQYGHEVVTLDNLAHKIDYFENVIESNDIVNRYCQKIIKVIKEEEIYDGIIPEIGDVEKKHMGYLRRMEKI